MIMPVSRTYTPAEAAALAGVGIKAVHNAIDKRIVDTVPGTRKDGASRRALTGEAVLQLTLWRGVGSVLTGADRQRLFKAIKAKPAARMIKADDFLIVDVAEARKQLKARIQTLARAEAAIDRVKGVMGGDPVFKGTRVPVRLVVAMLEQGAEAADILDGYPTLTVDMLDLARIWAAAHPARGRPKRLSESGVRVKSSKRMTLKRDRLPGRKSGAAA
jgi:uncharacterized protein (DUF433 family)